MRKTFSKVAIAATLMGAVFSQSALAQQLRLASGLPPMQPANNPLYTEFQKMLPEVSNGQLRGQLVGMEVVNLANMRTAINSGLVQVGLFLPAYFPADLPNFNLIGDLSLMGGSPHATAAAVTEYIATCADCQVEMKALGVIYTGSHANPYNLLTTKPVNSEGDLRGMRIRVATPQHARWVEAMGGTPVSMPTGEAFEALSQGIIEGTVTSLSDLVSFNLQDVIKHATMIPMGTFHSLIDHAVRRDSWASLSEENRAALIKASSTTSMLTVSRWLEMVEQSKEVAAKKNITLIDPAESMLSATSQFVAEDVATAVSMAEGRFGVADAKAKIERFQALVAKWEEIAASVEHDPKAMQEALQREVWDQQDLSQYGL
ncbi:C4-dicarboxylate TRAP transporter substrate-binding protein [Nitrincola tapanii]|uniref:C4-dicarboxylate ABC transporter substrate-binding protein n=1 Tax=Nitrincola tapanii TaxID=1708751 RepID=A0A5A9W4C5_9GAMM|nr:C4-dicarboxylate TRAP transporter substrate-binding protein [Nitrincola tapanii]KAA0875630.1 C4-dicarboxylate ABC transporter substrate-binding protein [Nitrincola tapanii]